MPFGLMQFLCAGACAGMIVAGAGVRADAGEPEAARPGTFEAAKPCEFFRGQSYRRGLTHFATEMFWVCEVIAARKAARMPLGDRLAATDAALSDYRAAVIAAGRTAFAETRIRDIGPQNHGLSDATKRHLAEETGVLAALEAIRTGY